MKNQNKKGILYGILFAVVLYGLGVICSGQLVLADTADVSLFPEKMQGVLASVYPFVFIVALAAAVVIACMKKKKAFAGAALITALVPFAAWGIEWLLYNAFPEGSVLLVPFMLLAAPAATLFQGLL